MIVEVEILGQVDDIERKPANDKDHQDRHQDPTPSPVPGPLHPPSDRVPAPGRPCLLALPLTASLVMIMM